MEKSKVWLIIGLIVIVSALVLRIVSPHDRWVCEKGQWRAQGSPRTAQPTQACADNLSIDTELQALANLLNDEPLSNTGTEVSVSKLGVEESNLAEKVDNKNELKPIDNSVQVNPGINTEIIPDLNLSEEKSLLAPSPENELELISPQPGEVLRSPYLISGRIWAESFSESGLLVSLQTESGKILVNYSLEPADITGDAKGWFNFQDELTFDTGGEKKGLLLLKKKSISQKSVEKLLLSIPVYLAQ